MTSSTGKNRSDRASGFTLIEVLVAVLLVSICTVSIFGVFHASLTALGAADNSLRADLIAREEMDRAVASDSPAAAAGESAGPRPLAWRVDVLPVPGSAAGNLRGVVVTVSDKDGARRALSAYARAKEAVR